LYGTSGELLYIGITSSYLLTRFHSHQQIQRWWGAVVGYTTEEFSSRSDLEHAEWAAIRAEDPIHNARRSKYPPGTPASIKYPNHGPTWKFRQVAARLRAEATDRES
jgi:hypothetical protein